MVRFFSTMQSGASSECARTKLTADAHWPPQVAASFGRGIPRSIPGLSALVLLAVILLLLAAGAHAAEWTRIRFGVEGAYPPFSEVTPDGELQGFDIDIAKALCEQMQAECTLVQQDWDGIIPGLLARKYDAIIASMAITEERKQKVGFTGKYFNAPARFVARKGAGIDDSKESLKGRRVGVQRATTHDRYLTAHHGDAVEIVRYGTQDEATLDLVAGRVDLVLANSVGLKLGLLDTGQGTNFTFVGPGLTDPAWFGEGAGIAVRKEDHDLRERLDAAIAAIRRNGRWEAIKRQYFGEMDVWGDSGS